MLYCGSWRQNPMLAKLMDNNFFSAVLPEYRFSIHVLKSMDILFRSDIFKNIALVILLGIKVYFSTIIKTPSAPILFSGATSKSSLMHSSIIFANILIPAISPV